MKHVAEYFQENGLLTVQQILHSHLCCQLNISSEDCMNIYSCFVCIKTWSEKLFIQTGGVRSEPRAKHAAYIELGSHCLK